MVALRRTPGWTALLLLAQPAHAYVQTLTASGIPVRWQGRPKLELAGNPTNATDMSAEGFRDAVVRSLERWQEASGGTVSFDYWQGTNPSVFVPDSSFDGLSSVFFQSNSRTTQLSPGVLGLTKVWYDQKNGKIFETDVTLNDVDYRFSSNPTDTSGFGSGRYDGIQSNRPAAYIDNVLTHELGHALGLGHSASLQATMLFKESPEQAHLSCDEQIAIHALYPSGDASARGSLEGVVTGPNGAPFFGAHVLAISRRRGTVLATGISDRSGHYFISALEPGTYYLMAEPFYAVPATLPEYYRDINMAICPGEMSFGRSFLTDGSGYLLQGVAISAGASAAAPVLQVRCSGSNGAAVRSLAREFSTRAPIPIFDGALGDSGFGITDRFDNLPTTAYQLKSLSGQVEIHALSYSLYSPIHPDLKLVDSAGRIAPVHYYAQAYVGDSGYVNQDSYLEAENLPPGDYLLEVSASQVRPEDYPAGQLARDSSPFLMITGTLNEGLPALADRIPMNARCTAQERFTPYTSPPGDPYRHPMPSASSGGGFCATTAEYLIWRRPPGGGGDGPSGSGGSGPGTGAIAGWFLPWALMLAMARIAALLASRARRRGLVLAPRERAV